MMNAADYRQALIEEVEALPDSAFPNLLQIVRLFKESILEQSQHVTLELQNEFEDWDRLSDEALENFEKSL